MSQLALPRESRFHWLGAIREVVNCCCALRSRRTKAHVKSIFGKKRFPSYSATSTHACLIYLYSIMRQLFLYSKFYPFPSRSMQSYLLISVHLMSSELVDIHIPLYMKNPRLRPLPFPTRTAVASLVAKEATICNSPSPSPCAR